MRVRDREREKRGEGVRGYHSCSLSLSLSSDHLLLFLLSSLLHVELRPLGLLLSCELEETWLICKS